MTTAEIIVSDALREIDVIGEGIDLEDADAQLAIRTLNRLMATLPFDVGYTKVTAIGQTLTTDSDAEDYMVKNLAKSLTGPFEKAITPSLHSEANRTKKALYRDYVKVGAMSYPNSFPMGSGSRYVQSGQGYQDTTYVSADYTLLATDTRIEVDCSDGPVTITLMAIATVDGYGFEFEKVDSTANAVIFAPNGSEQIDNDDSYRFWRYQQTVTIRALEGEWRL